MSIEQNGEKVNEPLAWDALSTLLKRPIAFHRVFGQISGGALSGLFLSQAFYWTGVMQDLADERGEEWDGWFYKEQADWEAETLMTRREQETARRDLKKRGLLEEKFAGIPRKLFYRLNRKAISEAVQKAILHNGGKRHYLMAESASTQSAKAPSKNGGKRHCILGSETTTEITQKQHQQNSDDDDDFSPENIEPKNAPTDGALIENLIALGVEKGGARVLAASQPENAARVVAYLQDQPSKLPKSGGGVRDMIEHPDKWSVPTVNATPQTPAAAPKKAIPAKVSAAAEQIYQARGKNWQRAADASTGGRLEYVIFFCADEISEILKTGENE